ncbi:tryptophan 2,3-dioxygenase [Alkalihalobacillus alcalophilus ATCC 27647 = CGMCC 1.3604]|uniref:Tryptophan 2,3-dioxygenase n=1 Tax=Alkalihalobacillus alcalophilus ATCC 27647 = CGMCC 1.3604 TaxID=1218173 RepID=A0A094WF46_ALKAL|nr:tryptophan 2,3-dioxygenase [Alkalihalobacillus alcalophilus]KGA96374.1 tryptophan 2,3-dioxygenase [Alkalihalobacillus alcalophilus ATCC 27647 = CGMCC 1.3604]MED1563487.1 tryptophan 2,3-dioxygenase [Alkalihalobacillus alcalophilus]THG90608.1 tryptophan 2,3-dioxygenase [Alkalihalobacillus alcalophilus ATCC 27647 = CGMCC 1.3604]
MTENPKTTANEKGIYTDFKNNMTYGEYLKLDQILSGQERLSDHHDEMLFIIIHQVSELWMKLILHETNAAIESIQSEDFQSSFKRLARVSKIQSQIIQAWDVLSTLTPAEYMEFRESLGQASGFQSYQYRKIEFALGYKTPHILKIYEKDPILHKELSDAFHSPGLYDVAIEALAKAGFSINVDLLNRDYSKPYEEDESVKEAWMAVYRNVDKHWDLYQLAEKLVDIEDWLQQWRFRHMKTVERIIGFKVGTGGSSGVNYLKKVLDQRFFPELWDLRTEL